MARISLRPLQDVRIKPLLVYIDGYPDMEHELEAAATEVPLEKGARASDHAVALPRRLKLTALVSNFVFATGLAPRQAWDAVQRLHRASIAVDVTTPWGNYSNMLIVKASAVPWGLGLEARLELRELLYVGIADTEVDADNSSGPASGRPPTTERGRVTAVPR